jgi:putative ABC transport system permease protein
MFIKNTRIAARFLSKHKEYSAVNILGLTLSFISALFIGLYIFDELSFESMHRRADRIYRVIERESTDGKVAILGDVPFRIAGLGEELPSIEEGARIFGIGRANFFSDENENKIYRDFTVSEQSFLDVFDFKVLYGSRENALAEANAIVLTKSSAEQLFGTADVVNKYIRTDRAGQPFKITAVLDDFPPNSHLSFNLLVSLKSFAGADWYKEVSASDWSSNSFSTYVLLKNSIDAKKVENAITETVNKNRDAKTPRTSFGLQPLTEIHFHSADIRGGYAQNPGALYYLYIFGAVGLFIITIACINYINLSTSLSITRGKEVGVKKVTGAGRGNLIAQFITESTIISASALLAALLVVVALLPSFNNFVGKQISVYFFSDIRVIIALLTFSLFIGLLSGSYPAIFLSKFKPALAIKGFSTAGKRSGGLRQALVVFQFALSITLILATLMARQQLDFVRNRDLGFQKDQLVVIDINSGLVRKGFDVIKTEISKIPLVKDIAVSSRVPGEWKNLPQVGVAVQSTEALQKMYFMGVDANFLRTFDIKLLDGRNFSEEILADSASFLINETAAKELGLADPFSESLTVQSVNFAVEDEALETPLRGRIVGIVKDFHFQSLHQKIGPMLIAFRNNPIHSIDYFSVRLLPGDAQSALNEMDRILRTIDPAHLIEYNFLDDRLDNFYRQDTKRGQLFTMAAVVSVGLACLGLFSLVSFMTEQRTKEIGIRKALGATTAQIVALLSSTYIKLVLAAFVIATPLAIWAINQWLQSFAYKTEIGLLTIIVTGVFSLLIAFVTVGYKSIKAAWENPGKSLRRE